MRRIFRHITFTVLASSLFASSLWAIHPNQPQGFDPERAYQSTPQIDQVDLYSGRLSAHIPVGPFSLFYNSNIWRYSADDDGEVISQPDRLTTAGLGWHLGWGEVYEPGHWYNPGDQWLYVGDDGSRHSFHTTLHYDDGNAEGNVFYTRDGSYLRLKIDPVGRCWAEVEFPEGTTRRFGRSSCGPLTSLRWTYSWDRFGSLADPDLSVTYNPDDTERTVTDRYGRVHRVHLTAQYAWLARTITMVDIESVGGQRSQYNFSYDDINVDRSCKDTSASTGPRIRVPHLKRIEIGDMVYSMVDGGALQYHNSCGTIDDLPGVLKGLTLPSGGKLKWEFQEFEFPPGGTNSVFNTSAGVKTRRILSALDVELGSWNYKTTQIGVMGQNHPEMRMDVVVLPEGDCSRHFFDAIYWVDPNPVPRGWENSLPFTYTDSQDGRYLSSQVWTGNDGQGRCDGDLLRSTYLRYRHDTLPGTNQNITEWHESNRQLDAIRTVFHDDGERYIDVERSEFDGLGNFRKTVTTGTLHDASTTSERREVQTGYQRSSGIYPGSYTPLSPSEPWIFGIFDHVTTIETEAEGETVARVEFHFDDSTGALKCARRLASGASQGATDLLTSFTYDGRGLATDVRQYGGDLDPIGVGQAAECGAVVGAPVYWQRMTYENGTLKTSRPMESDGTPGPYLTYDADLDPSTGFVTRMRDASGYEVVYGYDSLGRRVSVTPQDGASTQLAYEFAAGSDPSKIRTTVYGAGGGSVLTESEVFLDDLGRPRLYRTLMPGGGWSEREVETNARGWVTSVSEQGSLAKFTQYLDFDPFGRPGTVRPPEGAAHDMRLNYQGTRQTVREVSVATSLAGAETYFSTTSLYDSHGRLRQVTEPSGPGGSTTPTSYGYDVEGRMTRMTSGPSAQNQVRTFTYDNRGFMLAESHPETGLVSYDDFDAGGLVHRRDDGENDLEFTYDFLGRRTSVRDRNQGNRLVKTYLYDGGAGFGTGKVWKATRYNYLELPWTTPGEDMVAITDQFSYGGIGGAISQQDTLFTWPDTMERFRQWVSYDDLGNLSSLTYPRLVVPNVGGTASTSQIVGYSYDRGLLTSIPGWVDSIAYHASGLASRVRHANGVDLWQDHDPDRHSRLDRIYTTGLKTNFDSGTYTFDGAGNIESMGNERFRYDGVSRLVEANAAGGTVHQTYAYDRFGNLTQRATDGAVENFGVQSATNRLSGGTYDGAGNLLSYGGNTYTYNTSNRLTSQAWMRYLYNASGERVASVPNVAQRTVHYHLRDPGHRRVSEFTQSAGVFERQRDWVYGVGRALASEEPGGDRYHYYSDHLGTPRLIASGSGSALTGQTLLPFGEEVPYDTGYDNLKLAGHERDSSTGNDYMHARHYTSSTGRFLSVDPLRGRANMPQSLNRYAYVSGNPVRFADPDGRFGLPGEGLFQLLLDILNGGSEVITVTGGFIPNRGYNPFFGFFGGGGGGEGGGGGGSGGSGLSGGTSQGPEETEGGEETEGETEGETEEEDPCKLDFGFKVGVGAAGGVGVGGAVWADNGLPGNNTITTVKGPGLMVPGVHTYGGVKVGRGKISGEGIGGEISGGKLLGFIVKWNFGDNGAWFISAGGSITTPHGGFVFGATNTTIHKMGEVVEGQGCP